MTNSFNMSNWRHRYITMAEIASEPLEVDKGYYDRNKEVILQSIEKAGYEGQEAEEIFDLMKVDGLTQDEAIAKYLEVKADYEMEKGEEPEYDMTSDEYEVSELEEVDFMSLYEKYLNVE